MARIRKEVTEDADVDAEEGSEVEPEQQKGYFLRLSKSQRSERWKWEICITSDDLSFPENKFSFPEGHEDAVEFDRIDGDTAEWFWKGDKESEKAHMALVAFLKAHIHEDENLPSQSVKKWREQLSVREVFEYESEVFDAFDEDDSGEAEEFKKDADAVAKKKMPASPKERSDQKKPRASLKGVVDNMKETVWSSQEEDEDEEELLRQMKQIQKEEERIQRRKVEVEEKQRELRKRKRDKTQSKAGAKALLEVWDTMKSSMKRHRITVEDFMQNCDNLDQLSELILRNKK